MAVTAGTIWRVRPGGASTNGGGFDPTVSVPGTDYSKQDAVQVTYTDLVIGTPNTTCTSAGHAFTSAHVGNVLNVTSGTNFTVQRVVITSVSGSTATCNAALGTIGATGGNAKLGGALTFGTTPSSDAIYTACQPGNVVYILGVAGNAASYPTTSLDYAVTGGFGTPTYGTQAAGWIKWIGDPAGPMPTIGVAGLWLYETHYFWAENLYVVATSNTEGPNGIIRGTGGIPNVVKNCILNANNQVGQAALNIGAGVVLNCDIYGGTATPSSSSSSNGIFAYDFNTHLEGNFIHGMRYDGISLNGRAGTHVIRNIIYNCARNGITDQNANIDINYSIENNTIVGNGGNGISIEGTSGNITTRILNNNITSNGGYGLAYSNGTTAFNDFLAQATDYNNYYLNTSGSYLNKSAGANDLNVDPSYASSTDWTPTNTALGVGFPGLISGTNATSHGHIGAVQPAAGSTTNISVSSTSPIMISRTRAVAY